MDLYLNLIIFFIVSFLYFWSVVGYGKIIVNKNSNYFETYLDGTILLLVISYTIYLSIGTNIIINVIIILIGLILYFFNKKTFISIRTKNIFLLFLSVFSIFLISKTHEDFNTYHYFTISEIFNHNLRIGISKLNGFFYHSSLLALNQSILVLPYFDFKLVHLTTFLIYFSTLGYFITNIFDKKIKNIEVFYIILCLFVLLIKFNRLSEYGYDYIAQFILLIVFHKIYFLNSENREVVKSIIYFILAVLIKPISLLFLPIMFFIIYKKSFLFYKSISKSKYFLIFILLTILFSSSFFKTGCVFYPINKTCFSIDNVSWSEKERVEKNSELVISWARSFWSQKDSRYEKLEDKKLYNQNYNWVKYWIDLHFFYKVFEFLLIICGSIIIIYFCFSKDSSFNKRKNKEEFFIFILSFLSIIFWLHTVPQFRFGFSLIIIFIFLLFNFFLNLNIHFNKQIFFYILIVGLVVLNIKNINRINSEFLRNDFYKFNNFPFYNEKVFKNDYSNIEIKKMFHIDILK